MSDRTTSFMHTVHKTEVIVFADMIIGVFYFIGFKSTTLMGAGGSPIPVEGTVEEAIEKLKQARAQSCDAVVKEA